MAEQCFPTQKIADQYQGFIDTFSAIDKTWLRENSIDKSELASPELVALRLILVDHYRRIVLHDPHLPNELLPKTWIGERAYQVVKESYQLLYLATEDIYHKRVSQVGESLRVERNNRKLNRFTD